MRTRKTKFLIGGVLLLALAVAAALFVRAKPLVSVTIVGYKTYQLSGDIAATLGRQTEIYAVISVTNLSQQPLTYVTRGSKVPLHTILHPTTSGWQAPDLPLLCGFGMEECTLQPAQGITFETDVTTEKGSKVALDYSDGHEPSPVWDKLPDWLTEKLPSTWTTSWRTVTTEAIDLTGAQ